MKIALDIDGCITEYPEFFRALSACMSPIAEIYVITNRDPGTRAEITNELKDYGIHYKTLVITAEKAKYIIENDINVVFEDTDEYFLDLPESVCVLKVREPGNFDFETRKWIYGSKTGQTIESARGENAGFRHATEL
jgi:hypothetical protein